MKKNYGKAEVLHEIEWRRCKRSARYFIENYCMIAAPPKGRIQFKLRPAQVEALRRFEKDRYTIVLKARQIGWSTLVAALCLHRVLFREEYPVVMISEKEDKAAELLDKSKYNYQFLPAWMKAKAPKLTKQTALSMVFANGSRIESLPTLGSPARGKTIALAILDEWAFFPNADEAWAAIEPSADIGGQVIGLSTANGSGNFFHELWIKAKTGRSGFKPLFFGWNASERDAEWYERKKRELPDWQLAQEYPTTEDEAFIKSGRPVFDVASIARMELQTKEPEEGYMQPNLMSGMHDAQFVENSGGDMAVWIRPVIGHRYVIGADVAEGLAHGDYSACHVIDQQTNEVVARWRGHIHPTEFAEILFMIGHYYNKAFLGVEANNHGMTTLAELNRLEYPFLYRRQSGFDKRTLSITPRLGWFTSRSTKPMIIDKLILSLRYHDDHVDLKVWDKDTLGELRTYVRRENGTTSGQPHDDLVMSLAIANWMRDHSSFVSAIEDAGARAYSWDWWMNELEEDESKDDAWVIGA